MSAMKFTHEMTYAASPAEVQAMLADPAFRERVCRAMHAVRHDVEIDGAGRGMEVVVDQTQPAKGIPSFAKKVVGNEIRVIQRESWTSETSAALRVEIPGKPGEVKGGIELSETGDGTLEKVSGEIKVKIPVVGGKLEGLVAELLGAAMDTEEKVGRAWLSGEH